MADGLSFYCPLFSQSTLPPAPQALPPQPQPAPVHHSHLNAAQSNGGGNGSAGGFQQMARMMDSLILDNFGPFAFTKITTSHQTHRMPSRQSALKKTVAGSTSNLPSHPHGHSTSTGINSPSQTMRINMHRNSTSNVMGAKVSYNQNGE